jgi:hypothetical protein
MHLIVFVGILMATTVLKFLMFKMEWIVPPLTAWELAALFHVFLVAQKLMQFGGFEFATKKFNLWAKRWVLNVIGVFIILKLIAIFFETQVIHEGGKADPLLMLPEKAKGFNAAVHFIAPYILMMPLFFFFAVNYFARRHVIKQARSLGEADTNQERYLAGLMKFVDAPVVLPFIVMFIYLKYMDRIVEPQTAGLIFGVIGCCLLIVSNLLTGVFDEHWLDITRHQRQHSSGLV